MVSDYDAWSNLVTTHKYVSTWEEAAAAGINSGMDQEGGFGDYSPVDALPDAVRNGTVAAATVRRSFERLMRVRLRLGMFDPPASTAVYGEAYQCDAQCETAAKLALAREAAREGIVLFKNAGGALPLAKGADVALVGPQVDDWRVLLGAVNYAFEDGPDVAPVTIQKGLEAVAKIDAALKEIDGQIATDVLIIEDEPIISMDLEQIVRDLGHEVMATVVTRDEAINAIGTKRPGLVLADIQLADGSSGIDAVKDIFSRFSVPVIFITAYPERLLTGERPEPTFLITKPFLQSTVKAAIGQALFFHSPETSVAAE